MKDGICRTGILLMCLGLVLSVCAWRLQLMKDISYFFTIGVGMSVSGLLIAKRLVAGIYTFMVTLVIVYVWSFADFLPDIATILDQVTMPTIIGAYLFFVLRKKMVRSPEKQAEVPFGN